MISKLEKAVLIEVQRLPLTNKPFEDIANRLNIEEETVIKICNDLVNKEIIRRFGLSISHRKLGFDANPMTVLKVPEDEIDEVGYAIAAESQVTHCYSRSGWDYNLFFMIHAKTREEGIEVVKTILAKVGNYEYRILFSIRELKKISFEIPKNQMEVKN